MSSYPECDSYECEECPRRDLCVDYEPLPEVFNDGNAMDAFVAYIEDRTNELEEKVEHLLQFEDRIMRILAAVEKYSIGEEDR